MTAEDLRKAILQQAIQGKLVPQDPNDEPASVLLERIREEKARLVKEKKIKKDKNESIIYRGEDNSHYEKILATGEIKCIDEEIPFEIPQSWCWVRLLGVGKTETGTTPSKTHPEYFGDYMPFIGPGNIQGNKIVSYTQGISEIGVDYCRPVPQNTILQVCIGGSIGKAAITTEWSAFNQQINSIEPYRCVDYKYVFYTLLTDYFKKAMIERSTGTATPIINRSNWEGIILPIPPQLEQQRIVARIEELMPIADKYEKSQEALDKLNAEIFDKLKKSVLQEAIQGKLIPQDTNDEPASILLERIKEEKAKLFKEGKLKKKDLVDSVIFKGDDNKYYEKLGKSINDITDDLPFEIPNSWQWCRLSNIANLYTGNSINETEKKTRYTDVAGTEYIATKDVWFDNSIDYKNGIAIPDKYIEDFRIAPVNSVLMCIEGGSAGRKIGILSQDVCFGNKLCCLSPYVDISEYIFYYLQSPLFFDIFSSNKNGIIGGVSVNNLKQLFIPLPPHEEIRRIVEKIKQILKGIEG